MMRVSRYKGFDMYSDRGNFIGEVKGVILDISEGEILGLGIGKKADKWSVVPYERVSAIGDVIILSTKKEEQDVETETVQESRKVGLSAESEETSGGGAEDFGAI